MIKGEESINESKELESILDEIKGKRLLINTISFKPQKLKLIEAYEEFKNVLAN